MAIFLCLPEDDNVIEIDEARLPRQSPQRFFQTLKRRRGVAQSERHDAELEEPQGCPGPFPRLRPASSRTPNRAC
ncbi:hypothetical protein T01_1383 [Trichinella spiralis]|uniref:Uncharacterized protein n=1 Tax=Trichinella spiralis TaxID=6334 RepID=A0A0V1BFY1_TRISP|nr:hypothetical protein T01_1383 [Trichinella spiralis]